MPCLKFLTWEWAKPFHPLGDKSGPSLPPPASQSTSCLLVKTWPRATLPLLEICRQEALHMTGQCYFLLAKLMPLCARSASTGDLRSCIVRWILKLIIIEKWLATLLWGSHIMWAVLSLKEAESFLLPHVMATRDFCSFWVQTLPGTSPFISGAVLIYATWSTGSSIGNSSKTAVFTFSVLTWSFSQALGSCPSWDSPVLAGETSSSLTCQGTK